MKALFEHANELGSIEQCWGWWVVSNTSSRPLSRSMRIGCRSMKACSVYRKTLNLCSVESTAHPEARDRVTELPAIQFFQHGRLLTCEDRIPFLDEGAYAFVKIFS